MSDDEQRPRESDISQISDASEASVASGMSAEAASTDATLSPDTSADALMQADASAELSAPVADADREPAQPAESPVVSALDGSDAPDAPAAAPGAAPDAAPGAISAVAPDVTPDVVVRAATEPTATSVDASARRSAPPDQSSLTILSGHEASASPTSSAASAAKAPSASSASSASSAKMAVVVSDLDERILPLRMTPFQRPRRVKPLLWGGLAAAALLLLLPALLASILRPALWLPSPFGGPPDRIPRGASAWANATALTPLDADDAAFGAQSYPVDAQFAASYAARGGQSALGPAVTPAFTCNLGPVQFFANGALLHVTGAKPDAHEAAPDGLAPELASDGDLDTASGVEWIPLSHALLQGGSAAPIGGAGSALTYASLRAATLPVALAPTPASAGHVKSNTPLPKTIVTRDGAFIIEGARGGKLVGHSIPAPIWAFINQPQIAPHGWLRDIGAPLTEPLPVTITGSDGQIHHLLAQAFWQTIIVSDLDAPQNPQATTLEPVGLDYLRTFGAPAAHPTAGTHLWTVQDGALRTTPGASDVAVGLNTNAPVTLTGAAQWKQGALWYAADWSSPSRKGSAWIAAVALSATQLGGPTTAGLDALSPSLAGYLNSLGDDVGVVVDDVTRNTEYTYHPTHPFIMASSAKVPLMVSYLTMIESEGRGPNSYELSELTAMIEQSDNNAAQVIYDTIGYDSGQQGYMQSWGISDYAPNPDGWGWGVWSPSDMAHLLTLLQTGKVLNNADRALAFHLMESIESDQRFGVGDTAPAHATVAMKDGWVPGPDGSWFVNTSGIVTVGGETYIITVYTGEQNSFGSGQDIVNHVCGTVGQALQ